MCMSGLFHLTYVFKDCVFAISLILSFLWTVVCPSFISVGSTSSDHGWRMLQNIHMYWACTKLFSYHQSLKTCLQLQKYKTRLTRVKHVFDKTSQIRTSLGNAGLNAHSKTRPGYKGQNREVSLISIHVDRHGVHTVWDLWASQLDTSRAYRVQALPFTGEESKWQKRKLTPSPNGHRDGTT